MNTHVAPATPPALLPAGRQRTCAQCTATYRAPRATSRYCSPACRKRAHRGTATTDHKSLDFLRRWLLRRTDAGQIGPVNRRDPRARVYALTVPRGLAVEEWNRWNPGASMTDCAFASSLDELGIFGPDYEPPHRQRR
jgi:hypothetical protein